MITEAEALNSYLVILLAQRNVVIRAGLVPQGVEERFAAREAWQKVSKASS